MSIDEKAALYFGALLHDVGKVVYRGSSSKGTHAKLGADFISEIAAHNKGFDNGAERQVIEQIRYHHAKELRQATGIQDDSLAYITYFADNISAGIDRKNEGDESAGSVFDRSAKLRKIFNIIHDHHDDNVVEHGDYNAIRENLRKNLSGANISFDELNSLLNLLEATTSNIPSSTNMSELVDVSLYDHVRTTAGIAACMYDYCAEQGVNNYRKEFFDSARSDQLWQENMFLLFTCDMSGIQDFIYNISGSEALKQLRARSLYLELMMEHVVDELLARLELCRANLLYSGGGHAYLLLPNTERTLFHIQEFIEEVSQWFIDNHTTDLYLASAYIPCSAADLANDGEDKQRYPNLYRSLSKQLSDVKASRYSAETIRKLNFEQVACSDRSRECTECHRSDVEIDDKGRCSLCASLASVSNRLVDEKVDIFAVVTHNGTEDFGNRPKLDLPCACSVVALTREEYLAKRPPVRRLYTKNKWDMGICLATHLWMGDYTSDREDDDRFNTYALHGATLEMGKGIKRLGVLRADVDDLGAVFASGIPVEKASISRTATLSRTLSYFFKRKINDIFAAGEYRLQIIYSGGDDLFIVGNWSDVIYAAMDIRRAFREFTGNDCITLSAGVGMFEPKFPIARMASETSELEDAAKAYCSYGAPKMSKNAIALWMDDAVFSWQGFEELARRKDDVARMFDVGSKGKAFVYKVIALLRNYDEAASAPRLAYLLTRSFEDAGTAGEEAVHTLYGWASDKQDRKILISALEWYVCSIRERS